MKRVLLCAALFFCASVYSRAQFVTIYVNLDRGSDTFTGLCAATPPSGVGCGPVKTLSQAQILTHNYNGANCGTTTGPIAVRVEGHPTISPGDPYTLEEYYRLVGGLTFTSADSGCDINRPVVWFVPAGELAALGGGLVLLGTSWTCPNDNIGAPQLGDVCTTQGNLPGNGITSNAEGIFYDTPSNRVSGNARRFPHTIGRVGIPLRLTGQTTSGSTCNCATYPGTNCYDRFSYTPGDPLDTATILNQGGAFPVGDWQATINQKWIEDTMRGSAVDTVNHCVLLTGSMLATVNNGSLPGHRYSLVNILTGPTIQASLNPGEFYLDRRGGTPYTLYYKVQQGENPHTDRVIIPQGTLPLISGSGVQFQDWYNFYFMHDDYVVPAGGTAFQQNQYNAEPNELFRCNNCTSVYMVGNTLTQTDGLGIVFPTDATGLCSDIRFLNNAGFDLGSSFFWLGQFQPNSSDTDANVCQKNIVYGNAARGTGRRFAGEAAFAVLESHDDTFIYNSVDHTYGTGFTFCIPTLAQCSSGPASFNSSGLFNLKIVGNVAHDISQGVTGDSSAAGIYAPTYQAWGNVVANNEVFNVSGPEIIDAAATPPGYGGNGIYEDNVTANVQILNNLVFNTSYACLQNTRGPQTPYQPLLIINNIFGKCAYGIFNHPQAAPVLGTTIGSGACTNTGCNVGTACFCGNGQPTNQSVVVSNYMRPDKTYQASPLAFNFEANCGPFNTNTNLIKNGQYFAQNGYYNPTLSGDPLNISCLTCVAGGPYTTVYQQTSSSCSLVSPPKYSWTQWTTAPVNEDPNSVVCANDPFVSADFPNYNFTLSGNCPIPGFVAFPFTYGVPAANLPYMPATVADTKIISPLSPSQY